MRVYPAPGLMLRDPRTRQLVDPAEGVEVDEHDFVFAWLLAQGDARLAPPPAAAIAQEPAES